MSHLTIQLLRVQIKVKTNCPNCNKMLLYCKICGYMTTATCHGEKKLQKYQCILKIEHSCHNTDYVLTYKGPTESQYDHSNKQKIRFHLHHQRHQMQTMKSHITSTSILQINHHFKMMRMYQ